MKIGEEVYLGDAVYASFDGWQIRLRTGDGRNNIIYLEPEVYENLIAFKAKILEASRKINANVKEEMK